jgi:TPR repeat protein
MIPAAYSFIACVRHLLWRPWRSAPTKVDLWVAYFRGRAYDHPRWCRRNAVAAFRCYLEAAQADEGLPVAATMVWFAYRIGDGVRTDPIAAGAWAQRATELGWPDVLLVTGEGVGGHRQESEVEP